MRSTLAILAVLGMGCAPSYTTEAPTGSASIATDDASLKVFTANTLEGSVTLLDLGTNETREIDVGDQPTRIARVGDRMVVTVRGDRALVELDATSGDILRTLDTGPEPYGIVASQDYTRVYVAVSMAEHDGGLGVIEERDGATLEVLRTFEVVGQPRWLALHPGGRTLVIGSAMGDQLTTIDLDTGEQAPLPLPAHTVEVSISGMPSLFPLSGRVTGDPAFWADGSELAVPAFFVDNTSGEQGSGNIPAFPYYNGGNSTVAGRFNSGVVLYRVADDQRVAPVADVTQVVVDFGTQDQQFGRAPVLRSYLTSVVPSPDGLAWLAPMEASNAVMLIDATERNGNRTLAGMSFPNIAVAETAQGPRGLVVLDDGEVLSHSFLDRTVSNLRYDALKSQAATEINGDLFAAPPIHTEPLATVADSLMTPEQIEGMALFYSATSTTMGGAGVSCSTCHFEGRNDGLTWTLINGERNTPSLAGPIAQTGVVTWNNQIESVAAEAMFTAQFRMGSQGLPEHNAAQIEAFLDSTPLPDLADVDANAVERGRAIFEREDVACSSCHNGEFYTDGSSHDMYGIAGVTTRPLFGIASSAPYLHDGSAATLRDVLIRSRDGSMGNTGGLSEAELQDLEAFLKSL